MFAPILLLGAFYGATYRLFASARHKILGLAMATGTLIFSASKVEVSNVKIVGGNTMALIVMGLFATFAGPTLWSWVTAPKAVLPTRRRRVKLKKSGAPVGTGE
jgi:hypothetical protein